MAELRNTIHFCRALVCVSIFDLKLSSYSPQNTAEIIGIPKFFHYCLRRYPEKGEDLFDFAGELFLCPCGFPRFPNQGE
jgi:hypothetical protein